MNRRRMLAAPIVAVLMLAAVPQAALAHGLIGKKYTAIPAWLFGWAATVVLVASFVGLAVLWPKPRLEGMGEKRVLSVPRVLEVLCGAIGVGIVALLVYAGYAGSQTETNNIAPTFVFVNFWVGVPILSFLFGDVFRAFNPWRAVGRAAGAIATRVSPKALPAPMAYPNALGRWPAAAGILAFAWVELVYSGRGDPSNIATLILAYAAVQLVGMCLFGVEAWSDYGDGFGVYFGLFARLSPLRWERGVLYRRMVLSGLTSLDAVPGTVALACTMIGTTSFDGFSNGPVWGELSPRMTNSLVDIGFSQANGLTIAFTLGLVIAVALVSGLYRLGVIGMRNASGTELSAEQLSARFAHSLIPIALAYVVAHYISFLLTSGQGLIYLASDPLGSGANFLGTSDFTIDYDLVGKSLNWYMQVGALIVGHVAGLILAHDRALITFKDGRAATRSQYWMLAVMITFTSLGLWLLSAAQ